MIRIRHPQGTSTVELSQIGTLGALQTRVRETSGIAVIDQELRTGYPPRPIDVDSLTPDTPLSDASLGLRPGDQLTVSSRPSGSSSTSVGYANALSDNIISYNSTRAAITPGASSSTASVHTPSTPVRPAATRTAYAGPPALKGKPKAQTASFSETPTSNLGSARAPPSPSPYTGSSAPKKSAKVADGEVHVALDGQSLTLKVVDDDNSCLFNAVGMLLRRTTGPAVCKELRQIVASTILSSPDEYPEVILGHDPAAYAARMQDPKTWGGAMELAILSKHFQKELHAADVGSGVVHRFGEGMGYEERAWLLYSGIHYDAIALLPAPDAPLEFGTLRFPVPPEGVDDVVLEAVQQLVSVLKQRHYYTDTSTFALKCNRCQTPLQGQKQATEHAKQTGHTDFVENE